MPLQSLHFGSKFWFHFVEGSFDFLRLCFALALCVCRSLCQLLVFLRCLLQLLSILVSNRWTLLRIENEISQINQFFQSNDIPTRDCIIERWPRVYVLLLEQCVILAKEIVTEANRSFFTTKFYLAFLRILFGKQNFNIFTPGLNIIHHRSLLFGCIPPTLICFRFYQVTNDLLFLELVFGTNC